jgi:ubiquinone/menaquinone biosynthesis C-methylase UbiE
MSVTTNHRIRDRISWQIEWVQSSKHFQAAETVLEVGSGTFETITLLARKHPEKSFVGIDFSLSADAAGVIKDAPRNLTAIKHDIRNLGLLSDRQFDFDYSVAVLEHIRELKSHLSTVWAVLKDGGRYSFKETPFWSSSLGHHYEHNSPDCPIPHYGHLFMSKSELKIYLTEKARLTDSEVAKVMRQVYDREDLSRLSLSETRSIISSSSFVVESWKEKTDENYTEALRDAVVGKNVFAIEPEDLKISGVACTLRKPAQRPGGSSLLARISHKLGIGRAT